MKIFATLCLLFSVTTTAHALGQKRIESGVSGDYLAVAHAFDDAEPVEELDDETLQKLRIGNKSAQFKCSLYRYDDFNRDPRDNDAVVSFEYDRTVNALKLIEPSCLRHDTLGFGNCTASHGNVFRFYAPDPKGLRDAWETTRTGNIYSFVEHMRITATGALILEATRVQNASPFTGASSYSYSCDLNRSGRPSCDAVSYTVCKRK